MTTPVQTPIATFEDILDVLERNPRLREEMRRHLLGEEFLRLPETVASLVQTVQQILAVISDMAERQARTEADIAELKAGQIKLEAGQEELRAGQAKLEAGQARTESDIAELKAGQARTEADIAEIKAGQARTEADIAELKAGQAKLEAGQAKLEAGQARLEAGHEELRAGHEELRAGQEILMTRQNELKAGQDNIAGRLSNVTGTRYEQRALRRARRNSVRYFGLHDPTVIHGPNVPYNDTLPDLLGRAVDGGLITETEADAVDDADIILAGRYADGGAGYVVIEVSVVIDDSDVKRAGERAAILGRASAAPIAATAIGASATDFARADAAAAGVALVIMPE